MKIDLRYSPPHGEVRAVPKIMINRETVNSLLVWLLHSWKLDRVTGSSLPLRFPSRSFPPLADGCGRLAGKTMGRLLKHTALSHVLSISTGNSVLVCGKTRGGREVQGSGLKFIVRAGTGPFSSLGSRMWLAIVYLD